MAKAKPKARAKPKAATKAKPKAKLKAKVKPKSKAKPKAKVKPKSKAKPKAKAKSKSRARPARKPPSQPARSDKADLLDAIDEMVSVAPGATVKTINAPGARSRTPWMFLCEFSFPGDTTYDDLLDTMTVWRDDERIEKLIRAQRLSRIQARYITERGKTGEYTLAEIGPWELVISRAVERVGIRDDRDPALVERYGRDSEDPSEVGSLMVWFSSHTTQSLVEQSRMA